MSALDAAIYPNEITKLHETTDVKEVNEMLADGWILYAVTRGNLKFSYLLVRV
jgi:hypothetical protein